MLELEKGFGAPPPRGAVLKRRLLHTFHFWMRTEVHVYGFSIAANVLLSFFPFLIVMVTLCHEVLGWKTAGDAIAFTIRDYFPDQLGLFISNYLPHRSLQIASVLLLLFTANGIFEPLEVALNHAWGIGQNRSFVRNQLVSLGLIFACGTLGLASSLLTGMNMRLLGGGDTLSKLLVLVFFKMAAVPISIFMLFLIYWLLPNAKISARFVIPPAIFAGLALELLKYINMLTWPLWRKKLHAEYGPFYYSVTIVLWSFLAAMVILAGAEWAARRAADHKNKDELK
jgi:YihY family inner membrane protein